MVMALFTKAETDVQSSRAVAKGRRSARARAECTRTVIEAGDSSWRIDLPKTLAGGDLCPSPTDLLLGALAASAALIKDTIAPELGVQVYAVRSKASCGADGPDFQDMLIEIEIESSASESAVQRLLQSWRERSYVYLSLSRLEIMERVTVIDPYACP
jgi:uncharacterized OsmC-like protein